MCVKFSEPCRVIGDNPLFGHSQPIRRGIANDPPPTQPRGIGTRFELRASDVLVLGNNCPNTTWRFHRRPHILSARQLASELHVDRAREAHSATARHANCAFLPLGMAPTTLGNVRKILRAWSR